MARIKTLGDVATPTEDYAIANKKYVDDSSGGPGALEHIQISSDQVDGSRLDEFLRFAMDGLGSSNSSSVRSPIPFDLTIVRIGLTVAINGTNVGYEVDTGLALIEYNVNNVAETIYTAVLPANTLNIDIDINLPLVSRPGNNWAWRIFNADLDGGLVHYETHFHYVEQEQLNKNAGFKKYYDDRIDKGLILDQENRARKLNNEMDKFMKLSKINQAKSTAVITPTEGSTTVDNGTTAVKETNREQRHKSKKTVKSVHWNKLESNDI